MVFHFNMNINTHCKSRLTQLSVPNIMALKILTHNAVFITRMMKEKHMPITRLRSTPSSTVAMKTVSQTSCRCINNTNKGTLTCTYRKPQLTSYTATCNYRSIVTCVSPPYPVTQEIQRRRKQQTESYSTHVKVLYDIQSY